MHSLFLESGRQKERRRRAGRENRETGRVEEVGYSRGEEEKEKGEERARG